MSVRQRIADPQSVPVMGVDAHLPALPNDVLTPEALRAMDPSRWSRWRPAWVGDGRERASMVAAPVRPSLPARPPEAGETAADVLAAASVLVPLIAREKGIQVLLTRRTAHLKAHAGQISFPGGRAEPTDRDAVDTALREAEEEIGLDRGCIEVLGTMPVYTTVTRFEVTPVVALIHPPLDLRLDTFEVAEAFEVPLDFLMNPAHHRRHRFDDALGARHFLSMPWRASRGDGREQEFFIWGATAAMLRNLYDCLALHAGYHHVS